MNGLINRIQELRDNLRNQAQSVQHIDGSHSENEELDDEHYDLLEGVDLDNLHPDDFDFEEGRREYSGMPGNYQVVIRPVYNHIFLSRKYGTHGKPSIKMSWRFNQFGRIDLVDARLLPEKDICHLVKIRHFEELEKPWDSAIAFHYRLPQRVNLLNPGFKDLRYARKYQSILRFGHSMARDVIDSLETGNVRDSYVLGDQQQQLRDIVEDEQALCLLLQASMTMPSAKVLNRTVMKVFYEDE